MTHYWIAVASRSHVIKGVSGGFAQVCHGKAGPLKRMKENDWILYYSPTEYIGQKEPCQCFTAIGKITAREPYLYPMSETFTPWRRDVIFFPAKEVPIAPLIEQLSFIQDKKRWGFPFRRGCFSILPQDFQCIAKQMGIDIHE